MLAIALFFFTLHVDTQQEEAPPIIPYKGDPYTEVARTGLFSTETATPEQRGLPEVVMSNSPAYAEIRQPRVCSYIAHTFTTL